MPILAQGGRSSRLGIARLSRLALASVANATTAGFTVAGSTSATFNVPQAPIAFTCSIKTAARVAVSAAMAGWSWRIAETTGVSIQPYRILCIIRTGLAFGGSNTGIFTCAGNLDWLIFSSIGTSSACLLGDGLVPSSHPPFRPRNICK